MNVKFGSATMLNRQMRLNKFSPHEKLCLLLAFHLPNYCIVSNSEFSVFNVLRIV